MARVQYLVASTLDGYIAHPDGSFDGFVWDDEVVADFLASLQTYSTVVMGRKTYEVGLREGKTSPYPHLRQIVFSRSMPTTPDAAVEVTSKAPAEVVRTLRAQESAPIWVCGGATVATQLFAAGLIDDVIVKLNPVLFGAGIPLVETGLTQTALALKGTRSYAISGVVLLTYEVVHDAR
jgi:dihydrofolate reductase